MRTKSIRTVVATTAIGAMAATAAVTLFTSGAGAATGGGPDPITGGTTTISMSNANLAKLSAAGLDTWLAVSPASSSYNSSTKRLDYTFPVTGGDGSVQTFYGNVNQGGGLLLHDRNTNKSVTLKELKFDIGSDQVTAVAAGPRSRIAFFDANGNHVFSGTASQMTQPETFSASDLQIDPAGADYLNKAFGETVVTAGQTVGTFATSFTNTNG